MNKEKPVKKTDLGTFLENVREATRERKKVVVGLTIDDKRMSTGEHRVFSSYKFFNGTYLESAEERDFLVFDRDDTGEISGAVFDRFKDHFDESYHIGAERTSEKNLYIRVSRISAEVLS